MRATLFSLVFFISIAMSVEVFPVEQALAASTTIEDIHIKYVNAGFGGEKVQILIMPGHEPGYGGTELGALKERDVVVNIANSLSEHLRANSHFEVTLARDTKQWNVPLKKYFKKEWKNIQKFITEKKREWQKRARVGEIAERTFEVAHNRAATDVARRLYGINKWANEQGYDIVIHLHLNDNPGSANHSGFAVYVPDVQFENAAVSRPLGEAIANELNSFSATSTLAIENYGVVEDQDLIALGAYNTANFATVLIEYAYIYESKITNPAVRNSVLNDFAYQTYRGIQNYVGDPIQDDNTQALPHQWAESNLPVGSADTQVYALQVALKKLGFYPPQGELLIGCPISGYMGECTKRALKAFQKSKGLEQTGTLGPGTKAALKKAGF